MRINQIDHFDPKVLAKRGPIETCCLLFVMVSVLMQSQAQTRFEKNDSLTGELSRFQLFSGRTEIDLIDVGRRIINRNAVPRIDTTRMKAGKVYFSILPSVQYTLQTGFAVALGGNAAFYSGEGTNENISNIYTSLNYSQKKQFNVPLAANIWTHNNRYNIVSDWNFSIFPQDTYGLGGFTKETDGYPIDYHYVRLYQSILKTIAPDFYLGIGYDYDNYWNIEQVNLPPDTSTDWNKYGFSKSSISSGPAFTVLYDGRKNAINPFPSFYGNLTLRTNYSFLGSDQNWSSLLVDLRKYIRFPERSKNMFAFWSYNIFRISGKMPYLNLPSTASDEYVNMGRGYVQGRYRGTNLIYLESEYRYAITSNGLISGVIFINAQSYTETQSNRFETIIPGWGLGLRLKFNKFSRTNICIDYGFGINGSKGIFANLGEVF